MSTYRLGQLAFRLALTSSTLAMSAGIAGAQSANVTISNVNTLNLLAPFLTLNSTDVGQATLTQNLNGAVAVNNNVASNSTIASTSISDKTIFGGASASITLQNGTTRAYGPGANLAGGLPPQAIQNGATPGTVTPYQQYGGLGQLGSAYQQAVSPSAAAVPSVVRLLTDAYSATSSDLGVAKFYFANGTTNGTTTAVAPQGYTLPTYNGLPNKNASVYDTAYGVSNTQAGQNVYGDSRPVQVAPNRINGYDPNALTGLSSNPSFPSGHTTYAYTDGILTGMLVPQNFQAMVLRASEYGNSRIALGVHYPLDIIASRALVSADLANMLDASLNYTSLQADFASAQPTLSSYLSAQAATTCGTVASCANSNPYNAYSLATYGTNTPTSAQTLTSNSDIYKARMTYGLPTLSMAAAPVEAAPFSGPDASILLATLYGGSTTAATVIAPTGGIDGQLATSTINQIIMNTQGNALAAFAGTSLSYWSRVNLYDAAGYFGNVNGALTLAAGDQVRTDVTVTNGGVLRGPNAFIGTATNPSNVSVQNGGSVSPGVVGEQTGGTLQIIGNLTVADGGALQIRAAGATLGQYDRLAVSGLASLGGILDFELDGFKLETGESIFDILTFGSRLGDFDGLTFQNAPCTSSGEDMWSCSNNYKVDEIFSVNSLSLSFVQQVAAVPEASTWAMMLIGLAGLSFLAYRRPHKIKVELASLAA